MAILRTVGILAVLTALVLGVASHNSHGHGQGSPPNNNHLDSSEEQQPCTDDPEKYAYYPPCSPASTSSSSKASTSTLTTTSTTVATTETSSLSALERAHWCRLSNGTYLPYNFTFIHTTCSLCTCTKLRTFRCRPLQCMPTYCLDNSMPHREKGECCTRCRSDDTATNTTCLYNDIHYPHGSILKEIEGKLQCWCQLGNIECRNYLSSMTDNMDLLAKGAAMYLILMIFFVILIIGSLFCCGFTLIFYYYYQNNQQQFQDAYDQYMNSAGWQPVEEEEGYIVDEKVDEKYLEAEKSQYENAMTEDRPPAYGEHLSAQDKKQ